VKTPHPNQFAFDFEPSAAAIPLAVAMPELLPPDPLPRKFELAVIKITEHEGQPCVTDTDACQAIAYGQLFHFRQFIRRLDKTEDWGPLSHDAIKVEIGSGAQRTVQRYLLTEKQLVIIYMRCDLPNLAQVRSHIADRFLDWQHGRTRAVDAETEVKGIDSADRAIDAAPGAMDLLHQFAPQVEATRTAAERAAAEAIETRKTVESTQRTALETHKELSRVVQRKNLRVPDRRVFIAVDIDIYHGFCPICFRIKIIDDDGQPIKDTYREDHWSGHPGKRARDQMTLCCNECNEKFESGDGYRLKMIPRFETFQSHVRDAIAALHFTMLEETMTRRPR
jgi:hypothetical protein